MINIGTLPLILTWLSGVSFICYGFLCLANGAMSEEFERYGLTAFRKLVGFLELLGGVGALLGLIYPALLMASTAGLSLLMFLGVIVRLKIKDPLIQIVPAFTLMLINAYIFKCVIPSVIN